MMRYCTSQAARCCPGIWRRAACFMASICGNPWTRPPIVHVHHADADLDDLTRVVLWWPILPTRGFDIDNNDLIKLACHTLFHLEGQTGNTIVQLLCHRTRLLHKHFGSTSREIVLPQQANDGGGDFCSPV